MLGQVSQINRYDITLSLPNNLAGYIPLTSISDQITKRAEALAAEDASDESVLGEELWEDLNLQSLFSVGQYLRAYVTSTTRPSGSAGGPKRHIELSVNPKLANKDLATTDLVINSTVHAAVISAEDHGLVMDLGLEGTDVRGFMPSNEVGSFKEVGKIQQGAVYLCLVTGISSNGKIVKLSADSQRMGNVKKSSFLTDAPTVDAFLPGTAVELLPSEVNASGLAGKVMGLVDVTADVIHSGSAASVKPLEKRCSVGSKMKGRIICTFPQADEKKLGVSFLDHVLSLSPLAVIDAKKSAVPTEALPISTVIDEIRVAKVEPGLGLFVDVGVKGVRGFVHMSRISDSKVETVSESSGLYKVGSVHRGRIVGFNAMDGLFLVSLEHSVIEMPFLRLDDVKVGDVVKGTVDRLIVNATGVGGLIVNITEEISGFVPAMHFADVHLQHPEQKFKEALAVTARVLAVDPEKRHLRLTLKKSLVNSDATVWTSYEGLAVGMESPGTLIKILPSGAVVQFFGSIRGFLPTSQMSESYIQDPQQHFRVGQVVNVHILSIDLSERRMIVSCRDRSAFGPEKQELLANLNPGSIVNGSVSEKTNDEIVVELETSGLRAHLPFEHLTDGSAQKCLGAAKKIRVGQTLEGLVVLSKNDITRLIRLTSKSSLVNAARSGALIKSFEDITTDTEVAGFVNNVTSKGVFVQFAGDVTALLLKNHLHEDALRLPDFGMRRNQSISAKVLSIDHGRQRFLLTQKPIPLQSDRKVQKASEGQYSDKTVSNPADGQSTSVDDFTLGKVTKAKIMSVKQTQLNVQLADGVQGRIDISEIFDAWEDIKDRKHPLKVFRNKQIIPVRILGVHDSRNHRFLPITHSGKAPVFELSAKQSDIVKAELDVLTLDKVKVDSNWLAFVNNVADDCIWVNLSPNVRGRIRAMDVSDDVSLLADLAQNFPVGSVIRAHVLNVDVIQNRLDLSARSATSSTTLTLKDLSTGMVLPGRITKVNERHIMVQLNENISAPVNLIDLADDYSKANPKEYKKNQTIRVCITRLDLPNKRITLSTRPSRVLSSSLPVKDREVTSLSQLNVNDVVRGFIKQVADNGLFITLASNVTAYARVSDLSDLFLKDWKAHFEIDQLVEGKITAVDPQVNHVQLSLKRSVLDKNYKAPLTYADIQTGQIVTGKVRKVEEFGVFIVVDDSANVSGLCHRSEIAEERIADVRKLYSEGDIVKAKVLKVDLDKRRISFGLKASYFDAEEEVGDSDDEDTDGMEGVKLSQNGNGESDGDAAEAREINVEDVRDIEIDSGMGVKDDSEHGHEPTIDGGTGLLSDGIGLSAGGFDWTGGLANEDSRDVQSDTDGEDVQSLKKKKRRKGEIQIDRTGDLDANGPQSIADFERLLMGQPNSSYLWLSYMAFQLQLGEVTKAREIAERAIRTIAQGRDTDSERLNVWVAFLNLENTYGIDETVEEVFQRACEYNDPEEIHSRLTSIYIQSGKNDVSEMSRIF